MDYLEQQKIEQLAFQNIQPGDTVYRISWGQVDPFSNAQAVTVERVTKTQIVLSNGSRLRRESGDLIGGSQFVRIGYRPAAPHILEVIEESKAKGAAAQEFARVEDRLKELRYSGRGVTANTALLELARALTAVLDASELK